MHLGSIISKGKANDKSDFLRHIACWICDLGPDERTLQIIEKGYDDGKIQRLVVGLDEFHDAMHLGSEVCLKQIQQDMQQAMPESVHSRMEYWAAFDENEPDDLNPLPLATLETVTAPRPHQKKPQKKVKHKHLVPKKKKKKKRK